MSVLFRGKWKFAVLSEEAGTELASPGLKWWSQKSRLEWNIFLSQEWGGETPKYLKTKTIIVIYLHLSDNYAIFLTILL